MFFCNSNIAEDYTLVWQEEFDYAGEPDPAKWTYEQGFVRNREWQWYQPQNAYVRDGMLTMQCLPLVIGAVFLAVFLTIVWKYYIRKEAEEE